MDAEALREFAQRSREPVGAAKRAHWRTVAGTGDGLEAFDRAQELYEHARTVSAFPTESYAAEDLAHQIRLKQLIDRASKNAAFTRAAR